MKQDPSNFPCVCGHARDLHPRETRHHTYIVCEGCFKTHHKMYWDEIYKIACRVYKRDNLRYLESIHEEKASLHSLPKAI
jgi:hypothetical protein